MVRMRSLIFLFFLPPNALLVLVVQMRIVNYGPGARWTEDMNETISGKERAGVDTRYFNELQ